MEAPQEREARSLSGFRNLVAHSRPSPNKKMDALGRALAARGGARWLRPRIARDRPATWEASPQTTELRLCSSASSQQPLFTSTMASALLLAMVEVCVAESSLHFVKRARADREFEEVRCDLVCVTLYRSQDLKRAGQAFTLGVVLLCRRYSEPSRRPSRCPSDGTKACQDEAAPSGPAAPAPR